MKIVFLSLCSSFTEGMTYQDNMLAEAAADMGHEVVVVSNAEKFINGVLTDTDPCDILVDKGIRLIRLPYTKIGPEIVYKKIRAFRGIAEVLESVRPDIIFSHNHHYLGVLDVVRYKKKHPSVRVFADTHTSFVNSASNWISLNILHRVYYRFLVQKLLPYLEKYYYISQTEKDFSERIYKVPTTIMEFFPLGGFVPSEEEYLKKRREKRKELNVGENELLLVHSGKINRLKKTQELIDAFSEVCDLKARLVIIGSIDDNIADSLRQSMGTEARISYLGWKNGDELQDYLCAADIYCQPGTPSATLQNAICCRNAIISYPHEAYLNNLNYSCFYWCKDKRDIVNTFLSIQKEQSDVQTKKLVAHQVALEVLDYYMLLRKVINCTTKQ